MRRILWPSFKTDKDAFKATPEQKEAARKALIQELLRLEEEQFRREIHEAGGTFVVRDGVEMILFPHVPEKPA